MFFSQNRWLGGGRAFPPLNTVTTLKLLMGHIEMAVHADTVQNIVAVEGDANVLVLFIIK